MGLSTAIDLKRPVMQTDYQCTMKEDEVNNDSMGLIEERSPLHNGHLLNDQVKGCTAEASVSGTVAEMDNVTHDIQTLSNACNGQTTVTACKQPLNDSNMDWSPIEHNIANVECVPNGDSGTLPNNTLLPDGSDAIASCCVPNNCTNTSPELNELPAEALYPSSTAAENCIMQQQHCQRVEDGTVHQTNGVDSDSRRDCESTSLVVPVSSNLNKQQCVVVTKRESCGEDDSACSFVPPSDVVGSSTNHVPSDNSRNMVVNEELAMNSVANNVVMQSSSLDPADASARPPSSSGYIQESPSSPEPGHEIDWLPPLYVPDIPLIPGEDDVKQQQQQLLENDPNLMQAVLNLPTTAVDANPSGFVETMQQSQLPVHVEPHTVVRTYNQTPYTHALHNRRASGKSDMRGTGQENNNTSSASTLFEEALNSMAYNHQQQPHLDNMMRAGTSQVMTPLTINTDVKRTWDDIRRKDGIVSAPMTALGTSNFMAYGFNDRRRCCELTADEKLGVPTEQTLNKALDLLRSTQVASSLHSSALQSPSSSRNHKSCSLKTEVVKRKTMQDRLKRIRQQNALVLTIPSFETANATQMAVLLRRFKKYWKVRNYLPEHVIQHVFGPDTTTNNNPNSKPDLLRPVIDEEARAKLRMYRLMSDPDATESSSGEEHDEEGANLPDTSAIPSTSKQVHISEESVLYRYYRVSAEMSAQKKRSKYCWDECASLINTTRQQLAECEKTKLNTEEEEEIEECARCRPFNGGNRKFIRVQSTNGANKTKNGDGMGMAASCSERLKSYASLDDRCTQHVSSLSSVPLRRRSETFARRFSIRPACLTRTSVELAPWLSHRQKKNKTRVTEESMKRKRSYDREHSTSPLRKARRGSCSGKRPLCLLKNAGNRLVRRSLDYKRNNGRVRDVPPSLHSVSSESTDTVMSSSDGLDLSVVGLPQKIDYKEIAIPKWRRVTSETLGPKAESPCGGIAEKSGAAEISRLHLPLELNERKRFQQFRENVAENVASKMSATSKLSNVAHSKMTGAHSKNSATSLSRLSGVDSYSPPESHSPSTAHSPSMIYDDERSNSATITTPLDPAGCVPFFDRPSVVDPFPLRSFPLPPSLLHHHLT